MNIHLVVLVFMLGINFKMNITQCVELILASIMFLAIIAIFYNRHKQNKGIGARIIQFTGILLIVPLIGILALEKILEPQTVGTIIGALLGYLLSGISDFDSKQSRT